MVESRFNRVVKTLDFPPKWVILTIDPVVFVPHSGGRSADGGTTRIATQEQPMADPRNAPRTRRQFSLLAGGIFASLLGLGRDGDSEAKRKHKKRRRRNRTRDRCLGEGQACTTSFPGNGGCCVGFACGCGTDLCWVGAPGTCLSVLDPD